MDELWLNHQYLYYFAKKGSVLVFNKENLQIQGYMEINSCSLGLNSGSFLTNDGNLIIGHNVYRQSDNTLLKVFPEGILKERKLIENLQQSIDRYFPSNHNRQRRATQSGDLKLVFNSPQKPYAFYRASSDELMAYIFQDEGELVFMNQDGYFESSTEHPDFLTMLDETRKPIPINEVTFKKYNQPLNIKAK